MDILVIVVVLLLLVIGLIFTVAKFQSKKDQRFLNKLRNQKETIIKHVPVVENTISSEDTERIIKTEKLLTSEVLIGNGFLFLPHYMIALYSQTNRKEGVDRITWAIEIEDAETQDDSLAIKCYLPDDEDSFTLFTFEGLLKGESSEAIKNRLGL